MNSGPMTKRAIIVAGSQKCGTSSLCAALAEHSSVAGCTPKEPHFFAMSPDTVRKHGDDYLALFDDSGDILLDGSTSYLHSSRAIKQINGCVAEPTVFIIVRDPAQRAWSAYLHNHKKTPHADRREFEEIIGGVGGPGFAALSKAEDALLDEAIEQGLIDTRYAYQWAYHCLQGMPFTDYAEDPFWDWRYIQNSVYSHWVRKYQDAFGDRVHVLFFEDFVEDARSVMEDVLRCVGLPIEEASLELPSSNITSLPTSFGRAILGLRRRIPTSRSIILGPLGRYPAGKRLADAFRSRAYTKPPRMDPVQYANTRSVLAEEYDYWISRYPHLEGKWSL